MTRPLVALVMILKNEAHNIAATIFGLIFGGVFFVWFYYAAIREKEDE